MVSPSSPHMILGEFERKASSLFCEYFEHGDTQEVSDTLEEVNIKNFKPEVYAYTNITRMRGNITCMRECVSVCEVDIM